MPKGINQPAERSGFFREASGQDRAEPEEQEELRPPRPRRELRVGFSTGSAATAAALAQELTLPEVTQTVILTRAAGRTPVPERENLRSLAAPGATLVIYLSIQLLERVAAELAEAYGPTAPVVVAYRVSWPEEQLIRGTLADIATKVQAAGITRQALILVGPALAAWEGRLKARSRLYDRTFAHGWRDAAD